MAKCPKHNTELEQFIGAYNFRGQSFNGSYCKECNSVYTADCDGYKEFINAATIVHSRENND